MSIRIPNESQRTVIVGRTGSGKTVAGVWHLSLRNHDRMPWIIFDYKGDSLISQLPTTEIKNTRKIPTDPGLYVIHPLADVDDDMVEDFLWNIKNRGHCGIYIDEGYMLPNSGRSIAYRAIQTQGRSLKIPTITLSQRPVWMDRFVFSEADFYQVFHLNDKRDQKTIKSFMPDETEKRLEEYHSYYYDVGKDNLAILRPVPTGEQIIQKFAPKKKRGLFNFT